MKHKNNYDTLNFPPYRKEIVSLYNNKMSPEKIADLADAPRSTIEKILKEEGVKKRSLKEAMFKGSKIPTGKELSKDYETMTAEEMGIKYGNPGKPVSANTVCRWLRGYKIKIKKDRRDALGLPPLPTRKELEYRLNVEGASIISVRKEYRIRMSRLLGMIKEWGIEKENHIKVARSNADNIMKLVRNQEVAYEKMQESEKKNKVEKPIVIRKRKTVLDAYMEKEKDLSMEHEAGFDD